MSDAKESLLQGCASDNPYPVNLLVLNPAEIPLIEREFGYGYLDNRYNIGSWWWELQGAPPKEWMVSASRFDEIWAGSSFCQEIFEKNFQIPVFRVPTVVVLRERGPFGRDYFGLEECEYVFLFTCDFRSVAERKNPITLVKAFKLAFSPDEAVRLVLKISSPKINPEYFSNLLEVIGEAHNITIIDTSFERSEIDSLFHICDCYVSLHRAEGFGMTMAEAMLAGKPVIATGWSGNMDFMTSQNSYVVPHQMVELETNFGPYLKGEQWANPDLEAAAALMRHVYENGEEASVRALLGRKTIEDAYSYTAIGKLALSRLESLTPFWRTLSRFTGGGIYRPMASPTDVLDVNPTAEKAQTDESVHAKKKTSIKQRNALTASPAVSVCLSVQNGQHHLAAAIQSVLDQTFNDFEFLIVDDCSNDGSQEIIESFARRDKRIKYWANAHQCGWHTSMNQCFERAQGRLIKPFRQGDIFEAELFKKQIDIFDANNTLGLVGAKTRKIDRTGRTLSSSNANSTRLPTDTVISGVLVIESCLMPPQNLLGPASSLMFEKQLVTSGFNDNWHGLADLELFLRVLSGADFYSCSETMVNVREALELKEESCLRGLMYIADALKLGQNFEKLLSKSGRSRVEFREHAFNFAAAQVLYGGENEIANSLRALSNHDLITAEDCQAIAYHSLSLLGRSLDHQARYTSMPAILQFNQRKIDQLESSIRGILESRSWAITKPLREIKRKLVSMSDSSGSAFSAAMAFGSPSMESQIEYLLYLTRLQTFLLHSHSWKITRPLREFLSAKKEV